MNHEERLKKLDKLQELFNNRQRMMQRGGALHKQIADLQHTVDWTDEYIREQIQSVSNGELSMSTAIHRVKAQAICEHNALVKLQTKEDEQRRLSHRVFYTECDIIERVETVGYDFHVEREAAEALQSNRKLLSSAFVEEPIQTVDNLIDRIDAIDPEKRSPLAQATIAFSELHERECDCANCHPF
jgi:hypothetical protein